MKTAIVIPARLQSTRLEKKLLQDIHGKPLIQWVYERAKKVNKVSRVLIAVDDQELYDACQQFGAEVITTDASHTSGTDRIGQVAKQLSDIDFVVNLQGDEPLIEPSEIERFITFLINSEAPIVTMAESLNNEQALFDYNVVKLTKDKNDHALYFSRNAIPAFRDKPYKDWIKLHPYFRHVGLYGFRKSILLDLVKLPTSSLEKAESLEQLRWLENGYSIGVMETAHYSVGVDTQEDLDRVRILLG
jgi:3-deoxy-manno-octulosonate cytidylyltransferase (CMP-KDO synthetase)